jgi:hypothetical protein
MSRDLMAGGNNTICPDGKVDNANSTMACCIRGEESISRGKGESSSREQSSSRKVTVISSWYRHNRRLRMYS